MKNTNVVIYATLSSIIVILAGALFYQEKNNSKNIKAIEAKNEQTLISIKKEAECLPVVNFSMRRVFEDNKSNIHNIENKNPIEIFKEISLEMSDKIKYCGTERDVAENWIKGLEELEKMSQEKSLKIMEFKSLLSSITSIVKVCINNEIFINAPEKDKPICEGYKNWSNFQEVGENAVWGGCDFEVDKVKKTFKYCASLGEIKAVCTQDGCNF